MKGKASFYLEVPEAYDSNLAEVLDFLKTWKDYLEGFFVPDLPLNKATLDACAYLNEIIKIGKEAIPVQSVGHRSLTANKSRLQCLKHYGVKKVLLVQGPYKFTKVSDVLGYAVKRFTVGSVFNRRTLSNRISSGVKFFVTQLFMFDASLEEIKKLKEFDVYVPVAVSDSNESYRRLKEKGFAVPENFLNGDPFEEIRRFFELLEQELGFAPKAYLVPLSKKVSLGPLFDIFK